MILLLVVAALLAALVHAGPLTPNLIFNWTVNDMDPIINFDHSALGARPWNTTFSDSPVTPLRGQFGHGASQHVAYYDGRTGSRNPSVAFAFFGTRVIVSGTMTTDSETTRKPLSATIDSSPVDAPPHSGDVLLDEELHWGTHMLRVDLQVSGSIAVSHAVITTGMVTEATSLDSVPKRVERAVVDARPNQFFKFPGQDVYGPPEVVPTLGGVGGDAPIDYPHLVNGRGAMLATLPYNTSYLVINGTVGPTFGGYSVRCTPQSQTEKEFMALNASNPFTTAPVTLYMTPLDPTLVYECQLSAYNLMGNENRTLGVHSWTMYSALANGGGGSETGDPANDVGTNPSSQRGSDQSGSDAKSGPNIGAIVGGVVGSVTGCLLIVGAVLLIRRSRRKRNRKLPAFVEDSSCYDGKYNGPTSEPGPAPKIEDDAGRIQPDNLPPQYNAEWKNQTA